MRKTKAAAAISAAGAEVARQRIRGQIGFSSMAAQNKPQRVIKVSADEYLEELKKMYFKTKYIKRGHTQTRAVCPSMTRAVWPSMGASALPSAAMSTPTAHQPGRDFVHNTVPKNSLPAPTPAPP